MKKLLVLLIACLALTIAACGGDDDDDDGGGTATPTTEQTETTAPPAEEGAETVAVDIPAIEFDPADVTVTAGSTVKWTNSDDLPHTVTKIGGPGPQFDSGNLDPGDEFEQTFDKKGKVNYVCTVHAGQEGTVTVE